MSPEDGVIETARYFAGKIYELAESGLDDNASHPRWDTALQDACTTLAVEFIATLHQNGAVQASANRRGGLNGESTFGLPARQ